MFRSILKWAVGIIVVLLVLTECTISDNNRHFRDLGTSVESPSTLSPRLTRSTLSTLNFSHFSDDDDNSEREAIRIMSDNQENGFVMITSASAFHSEFTLNWIESLKRSGYTKYVVFCTDRKLYDSLEKKGLANHITMIPNKWATISDPKHSDTDIGSNVELKYATPIYNTFTYHRIYLIRELLMRHFSIIFSDDDVVWLKPNVTEYIELDMEPFQLKFMKDYWSHEYNGGFYFAKSSQRTIHIFAEVIKQIENRKTSEGDQAYVNKVLKGSAEYCKDVAYLDRALFQTGYVSKKRSQNIPVEPIAVHANGFKFIKAKKEFLQSKGFWYI